MTYEAKVQAIATQMKVSYNDALQFLSCVSLWMAKGHTFEMAVVKHMETMREGCAIAAAKV